MIFADAPEWVQRALLLGFVGLILALFVGVPIIAIRVKRFGPKRLQSLIDESVNHGSANEPIVTLQFHTYHGLIAFVEQTNHNILRPASQAKWLLRKFHRFNLTYGLLALGAPITPILAYRSQMRSIDEQCREAGKSTEKLSHR
jgi:hypothetical protein